MKLNFGRRIILFIHWLVSLILVAAIVFSDFTAKRVEELRSLIGENYTHIAFIVFVVVYLLLSLAIVCLIFRRDGKHSERGFITVDASDTGKVRIAVSAIEQMVRQAAHTVDGIADMKISISNGDDAIAIQVNVNMVNGSHVPTVTLNLQRAIRQFVEMNCGVAVRSVSINIQAVTNLTEGGRRARRVESRPAMPVQPQESSWTYAPAEPTPEIAPVENAPVESEPSENEMDQGFEAVEGNTAVFEEPVETAEEELTDENQMKN